MIWKVAAVVWLIIEVVLSHTPGDRSGAKSKTLSRLTGIKEGLLRRAAHVFLFAVLGLLAGLGFGWYGIGFAALWSFVDEATKPLIPGRHCSALDIGLNLIGVAAGLGVWALVR